MKKIISLFKRNYEGDRKVLNEVVPGAEWVINGEGIATRKFDGTCTMLKYGLWYGRFELKNGKPLPNNFIPAQDKDPITGDQPGWLPITENSYYKFFQEALKRLENPKEGTYELCGTKINKNRENLDGHYLIRHGKEILSDAPRDYEGIRTYLSNKDIKGIVWHHPDGRMVKIKKKDF